jgi:hypothetical protein
MRLPSIMAHVIASNGRPRRERIIWTLCTLPQSTLPKSVSIAHASFASWEGIHARPATMQERTEPSARAAASKLNLREQW